MDKRATIFRKSKAMKWVFSFVIFFAVLSCALTGADAQSVLTYIYASYESDFDPSTNYSTANQVLSNAYEPLLWANKPGSKEEFTPGLATSYTVSNDGLRWVFNLRKGVKFHNGKPFTAKAVKYSIERTKRIAQGAGYIWDAVQEITIIDDHTVQVDLSYKTPLDVTAASAWGAWIMEPEETEAKGRDWFLQGHDTGTGPYTIQKVEAGQAVILRKFKDYWGGWKQNSVDIAVLKYVTEAATAIQLLRGGEVDILNAGSIPYEMFPQLQNDPNLEMVRQPSYVNLIATLNTKKSPTDNLDIRRAIAHATPREIIAKNITMDYSSPSLGPLPRGMVGFDPNLSVYEYNLDKARELVKKSGYTADQLTLTYSYEAGDDIETNITLLIQDSLRKIGIKVALQPEPWDARWAKAKNLETSPNIFTYSWWPVTLLPSDFLWSTFHTEDPPVFNTGFYSNKKFDGLLETGVAEWSTNREQGLNLLQTAQTVLMQDCPALFLGDFVAVYFKRKQIKGFDPTPVYQHVVFFHELSK